MRTVGACATRRETFVHTSWCTLARVPPPQEAESVHNLESNVCLLRIESNMERGDASLEGSCRLGVSTWCLDARIQEEEAVAHAARVQADAVRDAAVVQGRGACRNSTGAQG